MKSWFGCSSTYMTFRKKCPYSEFFWSLFFHIRSEYGKMFHISPYSVRIRENTDQKNSEYGPFYAVWAATQMHKTHICIRCPMEFCQESFNIINTINISCPLPGRTLYLKSPLDFSEHMLLLLPRCNTKKQIKAGITSRKTIACFNACLS